MPGAAFKLLAVDAASGRFTLLIRLEPECAAPRHRHVGAVEGLVLSGGFHYSDDPTVTFCGGSYLLEREGATHQPISPQGALMFAVFHGPVEGLDAAGRVTGRIDWKWHLRVWSEQTGNPNGITG
jgi:anti-sigma factor ChrR (cupin superfamily)